MSLSPFVHLLVHSEYSLVDGVVRIKSLVNAAKEGAMPAVAVTDQHNLFAMVKFYRAAISSGVKPLIGVDLQVEDDRHSGGTSRLILMCQNTTGYRNLTVLVSKAYMSGQVGGQPQIQLSWLTGNTDGLIALSGGAAGQLGKILLRNNQPQCDKVLSTWQQLFPDRYYLQIQRTGRGDEEKYLHAAVDLALSKDLPLVAVNDVRFLTASEFESHDARVCIQQGRTLDDPRRPKLYSEQQYFRSTQEMSELFSDVPEALYNTLEIAKRCNLELDLGNNYLPNFPIPEGQTMKNYFSELSRQGLEKRLAKIFKGQAINEDMRRPYDERLQIELDVIIDMGFPGYFLIVSDFIGWAKRNLIPVGPGRGSGAGSLVAYALDITDIDPLQYELLFERFLNPERVSMPDFDIDFCMDGRDRVIEYVSNHYGADKVSQIITYGSMAAKAVVRDVGRVMGHPYGFVDRIAKMIPFDIGITLDKALAQEEALQEIYNNEEDVHALIDMARSLEGLARNAGKHAGGVVIAPSKLTDFTPLYCEEGGGGLVTQFDKDDVEAVGLVKFDFLGLRTLTIIDWAVLTINRLRQLDGEDKLDITEITLDDPAAFLLLNKSQTTAVFQLESRGMKDLIHRLQPDDFEDIIALVALFRPGPLQSGMVDDFINRKHGRASVEYPHPALETILKPTYGVILYQEQVMQIAQVLAGYTLGGADMLRRAMGKKKPEEMAKQRQIFTDGAVGNAVEAKTATYIFDLMEKFAGYGFNKSHSAAYALVSYQTAWLKAHYPAAFMAAVLSADMDNTDKVVTLIDDCGAMDLDVIPPDINVCEYNFTIKGTTSIYYGLGAIKGVGEAAIDTLRTSIKQQGPMQDLFSLCRRIDVKKVNRRCFEAMIRAGAMDVLGQNRATLMASLDTALQSAEQYHRNKISGQSDMFGSVKSNPNPEASQPIDELPYVLCPDWTDPIRLNGEKETLGLYLSGHPIEQYQQELQQIISSRIVNLNPTSNQSIVIAGLIVAIRTMNTRRGDRMAFVTLDDRSGRVELAVFSDTYQQYRDLLAKDNIVVVKGEVSIDEYTGGIKMSAESVYDINKARELFAKRVLLSVSALQMSQGYSLQLAAVLKPYLPGECPVVIDYESNNARAKIRLGEDWRIQPTDELLHQLRQLTGDGQVTVVY
ncbi:MAG: DNA polymerase III subunit alpha [Thiohalomonadales bacterium]